MSRSARYLPPSLTGMRFNLPYCTWVEISTLSLNGIKGERRCFGGQELRRAKSWRAGEEELCFEIEVATLRSTSATPSPETSGRIISSSLPYGERSDSEDGNT